MESAAVATDAQIKANRTNAKQHATGPKSPQGKSRSAANACTHGLAALDVVPLHERACYDELLGLLVEQHRPADEYEMALVEQAARARLTLARCAAAEEARFDRRARRAGYDHALAQADRADRLGRRLLSGSDPEPPAALARALGSFSAGAGWLLERWEELELILKDFETLDEPAVRQLLLLWGRDPSDPVDPVVREALEGIDDPEAVDTYKAVVADQQSKLGADKAKSLDGYAAAERSEAAACAGVDAGEEGVRVARYEAAARRAFEKAMAALRQHRRDPEVLIPRPPAAPPQPVDPPAPPAPINPRASLARALPAEEADVDVDLDGLGAELEALETSLDRLEAERSQFAPGSEPAAGAEAPPEVPPDGPEPA
jgi:hypothetical protein